MTVPRYWDLDEVYNCQHCGYDNIIVPATYLFYYPKEGGGCGGRGTPACDAHTNIAMIAGCKLEKLPSGGGVK